MRFVDSGERDADERTVRYLTLNAPDGGQAWGAATNTPARGPWRIPDEEWLPAKERAAEEGETLTDVVRRALREYGAGRRSASER
jgi:hypothetical protein